MLRFAPMQSRTRLRANTALVRIGAEIRRRRQKLGISQAALATKAGVHYNVVGRLERGKYNPSVMTLDAIAAALNTSMVDLLRRALK
jgi:transcriptional regulator with XRE-family HTH domain